MVVHESDMTIYPFFFPIQVHTRRRYNPAQEGFPFRWPGVERPTPSKQRQHNRQTYEDNPTPLVGHSRQIPRWVFRTNSNRSGAEPRQYAPHTTTPEGKGRRAAQQSRYPRRVRVLHCSIYQVSIVSCISTASPCDPHLSGPNAGAFHRSTPFLVSRCRTAKGRKLTFPHRLPGLRFDQMIGSEFSDVLVVIVNRKGSGTRGLKCDSKVPEGGSESIHASLQTVPITRIGRVVEGSAIGSERRPERVNFYYWRRSTKTYKHGARRF
jgi:hypothetical protein